MRIDLSKEEAKVISNAVYFYRWVYETIRRAEAGSAYDGFYIALTEMGRRFALLGREAGHVKASGYRHILERIASESGLPVLTPGDLLEALKKLEKDQKSVQVIDL